MSNILAFLSYTLAGMSGICFTGGVAILKHKKEEPNRER